MGLLLLLAGSSPSFKVKETLKSRNFMQLMLHYISSAQIVPSRQQAQSPLSFVNKECSAVCCNRDWQSFVTVHWRKVFHKY